MTTENIPAVPATLVKLVPPAFLTLHHRAAKRAGAEHKHLRHQLPGGQLDGSGQEFLVSDGIIPVTPQMKILVAVGAVDFRNGIDGLTGVS